MRLLVVAPGANLPRERPERGTAEHQHRTVHLLGVAHTDHGGKVRDLDASAEDIAGVASARACWIALDGEDVPGGSGFTPLSADPEALRAAARSLAPHSFADSHSPAAEADGAA